MNPSHHYTLSFSCPDRVGIVARVTGFFAEHRGWILSSSQHADADSNRYFMRLEVRADSLPFDCAELQRRFAVVAAEFGMEWRLKKRGAHTCEGITCFTAGKNALAEK